MNLFTSRITQTVLDQSSNEIEDRFLYEEALDKYLYFNQDYKQEVKILKEKEDLTFEDCLWLENNCLKGKGIVIIRSKQNIEVKNLLTNTSVASFEFSSEESDNSYIKVIKLFLDFLCHQD